MAITRTGERMTSRPRTLWPLWVLTGVLATCSAGQTGDVAGSDPTPNCAGLCADTSLGLTVAEVQQVLAQGIAEALARGSNATLAVVDRVGNVLAVYRMGSKETRTLMLATRVDASGLPITGGGLEGIRLPVAAARVNLDDQAAIAKAITGAYLSSEGNAFSTRTASQIVQEHFDPAEARAPAGPLFGVQFSQLACSDLMQAAGLAGPHRSPLGLSADPGGFPLYKNGTPVGGVGVVADGRYGLDPKIDDRDNDIDEAIAYAAAHGFAAPIDRRADRITVGGKTLRFSDVGFAELRTVPARAPAFASLSPATGALISVAGYSDGTVRVGTIFGQAVSGIRPDKEGLFPGQDAFVLVDGNDLPRFAPRAGTEGSDALAGGIVALAPPEVQTLLRSALAIANRTRTQIRRPAGTQARVTIAVSDSRGAILGIVRTRDAPVFGVDVSLQKARSAAFFSSNRVDAFLDAMPDAKYLRTSDEGVTVARTIPLRGYSAPARLFLGPTAFADGAIAYSARAIGNLARPFFPDGIDGTSAGPFSKPPGEWSVLSTGLQLDLSLNAILQHLLFVAGAVTTDVTPGCTGVDLTVSPLTFAAGVKDLSLGNGLQIFAGGVPVYRGAALVGAVGVSGDGVDQDDMIAFLAVRDASVALGGTIANAPPARRADTLSPYDVRLRYVQCPQAPFLDNNGQRPCAGN